MQFIHLFLAADPGSLESGIWNLFGTLRYCASFLALLSIAVNGVLLLFGNERSAESAKSGILYSVLALAAISLIPLFFSLGKSFFALGWDPYVPGI